MLRKFMLVVLGAVSVWADDGASALTTPAPDKSAFTLWRPTPRALLRELTTDRPDKTESPYTVDAGHVQIEADLVNYSYDRHNSDHTRTETLAVAPMNLKVGLCNRTDFQVVVPTYTTVRVRDTVSRHTERDSGFGDLVTRLKINLWGNDGGDTALGVMPFLTWPTSADGLGADAVEGGVIVPLAVALPHDWNLGLMAELDFVRDENGGGHHAEVISSVTVSHAIVGELSGYVEFFNNLSTERHGTPWIATADCGLTYGLTPDIQLDCGVNLGLTRAADDVNPFVGISFRF
jgi:hypothetical protein